MKKKLPPKPDPLALLWSAILWEIVYQNALLQLEVCFTEWTREQHEARYGREDHLMFNRYNRSLGYAPAKKEERSHLG